MSYSEEARLRHDAQAETTRAHLAHDNVNHAIAGVFELAAKAGQSLGIDAEPGADVHHQIRAAHRLLTDADVALTPQADGADPRAAHVDAARAHISAARDALARAGVERPDQ